MTGNQVLMITGQLSFLVVVFFPRGRDTKAKLLDGRLTFDAVGTMLPNGDIFTNRSFVSSTNQFLLRFDYAATAACDQIYVAWFYDIPASEAVVHTHTPHATKNCVVSCRAGRACLVLTSFPFALIRSRFMAGQRPAGLITVRRYSLCLCWCLSCGCGTAPKLIGRVAGHQTGTNFGGCDQNFQLLLPTASTSAGDMQRYEFVLALANFQVVSRNETGTIAPSTRHSMSWALTLCWFSMC